MAWEWMNMQLTRKELPPVLPGKLEDTSWAKRILANVYACIGLLAEFVLDLSLSTAFVFDSFSGFGLAAAIVSSLSFFMHLYVFWSSLKPMSKFASTSSGSMLLMVVLTDCSDSLFLTAVGSNIDATTIIAAFLPCACSRNVVDYMVASRPLNFSSCSLTMSCIALYRELSRTLLPGRTSCRVDSGLI